MPRILVISAAAAGDLEEARRWLRQPGAGEYATARLARIRTAIRELKQNPCKWPEGEHPGIRECPIGGYMIMYEVVPDTNDNRTAGDIKILRLFGPYQLRDRL
jgi:plasmid stabilization system protein ParE